MTSPQSPIVNFDHAAGASRVDAGAIDAARRAVAALAGGGVVSFLASATHALNQLIGGLRPTPLAVALDPLAHDATRRPALRLGVPVWTLPHGEDGRIDLSRLEREWRDGTSLVVLTHGSNVNGVVQPVAAIAEVATARGARVIVDASQTAGVLTPLELGLTSAVVFSGHKHLGAAPGVGALVLRDDLDLEPLVCGAGGGSLRDDAPEAFPERLEAGTANVPGIIAMGEAAASSGPWDYRGRAAALREAVLLGGVTRLWSGELPVVSFLVEGLAPAETEARLAQRHHIRTRAGLHCASAAHGTLGTLATGTVRVSAGRSTSDAELERLTRALRDL